MKLITLQENLTKGLTTVSHLASTKAQLPVLNNILLSTDKGRLKLSATNLETGINFWLGAKIEKEGNLTIPARILTDFVASLPAGQVQLEVKENKLFLNCGMIKANFIGLPASEFPSIPSLEEKEIIFFQKEEFINAVSQVAFAAAQDESRPVLTGVLLVIKEGELVWVATDGYRLSLKKTKIKKGKILQKFKKGFIIPSRTLIEVARIVDEQDQTDKVGLAIVSNSNQTIFSTSQAEIISRLIEGQFPEFEKIIPTKGTTKLVVETEELARAVKVASIFARESANIVKLEIGDSKIKVSANTPQIGDNLIEVEAKTEGEKNKIAFNFRYLLDFLNAIGAKQINLQMTTALNPGVFTPLNDNSYLHLIMPVRVQE